jgi:hypothetical protein
MPPIDRSTPRLLVERWRSGAGPRRTPASLGVYQSGDGEWLLLALAGAETAAPEGAEQASVYFHWQGSLPGDGYLDGRGPLSLFAVDVEPAAADGWDAYYRDEHFPAVLRLPGYAAGARFRLERRLKDGLGRDPEWLTIYQLDDDAGLERLSRSELQSPAARNAYDDWLRRGQPHTSNLLSRRYQAVPA